MSNLDYFLIIVLIIVIVVLFTFMATLVSKLAAFLGIAGFFWFTLFMLSAGSVSLIILLIRH